MVRSRLLNSGEWPHSGSFLFGVEPFAGDSGLMWLRHLAQCPILLWESGDRETAAGRGSLGLQDSKQNWCALRPQRRGGMSALASPHLLNCLLFPLH